MKLFLCDRFCLSMLDPSHQDGTPLGFLPVSSATQGNTARIITPVKDPNKVLYAWLEHGAEIVPAAENIIVANEINDVLNLDVEHCRQNIRLDDARDAPDEGEIRGALIAHAVDSRGTPYSFPRYCTRFPAAATLQWWMV